MVGQTINNYVLEKKIGEGGMGNVYYARHNRIDRVVAIKVLHQNLFSNEGVRNRFKNEANALIKLLHPNIVKIYDYVEQEHFACLIIEYIEGLTLDEYITRVSGPLPSARAKKIICEVLDAVQYAHEKKVFHRDIKPGNIMVSTDGTVVKVMDFGIAKLADDAGMNVTRVNAQLGTPFYMSPEQVKGLPYTVESDIYSLGVTLYEMVTGKCPYQEITNLFELQNRIVNEPLPPTTKYYPDVSQRIQEAITIATAKEATGRFRSCAEFREFLLKEARPVVIPPVVVSKQSQADTGGLSHTRKKRGKVVYSSIVIIVLLVLAGWLVYKDDANEVTGNVASSGLIDTGSTVVVISPTAVNKDSIASANRFKIEAYIAGRKKEGYYLSKNAEPVIEEMLSDSLTSFSDDYIVEKLGIYFAKRKSTTVKKAEKEKEPADKSTKDPLPRFKNE